jgi:hypothetical protein
LLIADLELREAQDYKDISERSILTEISRYRLRSRRQFNLLATSNPGAENQNHLKQQPFLIQLFKVHIIPHRKQPFLTHFPVF